LKHVAGHDRDVYIEDDRAVDIDEIFDANVLMEIVTSIEEGETFCPIDDDYEGDDTTTSCATLALASGAEDTSTNDG